VAPVDHWNADGSAIRIPFGAVHGNAYSIAAVVSSYAQPLFGSILGFAVGLILNRIGNRKPPDRQS
jgi:hypothetical protein